MKLILQLVLLLLSIQQLCANFTGFLEKATQLLVSELDDIHITELYSLEELTLYKLFQVSRFSFQNLENEIQVTELEQNQKYQIDIKFLSPKGIISMNNESVNLPVQLQNLKANLQIEKHADKQSFYGTDLSIDYDDISFDLGLIGYVIPDSVLRGESMKKITQKAEKRGLIGFNRFLKSLEFIKFKDNSMVLDMQLLFQDEQQQNESDNLLQQQQEEENNTESTNETKKEQEL